MTLHVIFLIAMAVVVLIVFPIVMIWSVVDHLRGRGSQRPGSGGISAGIGAALQELDRLMTRPSIEYKIETEHPVQEREDDKGE